MKVAVYSRKSRMTGKGESIKNQIDLCKEHMNKYFEVKEFLIYEDEGFSGGNSDRPQYKKMLEDAKSKKFSALICYRLDRISRNISDFSDTIELLRNLDIDFISLREQFDTSTPMGRAMMYIASVFAQLERETIAERIKDNMLSLARTGRWLGGNPPTGYVSQRCEYYDEESNKKTMYRLKQVKEEICVVKKIFDKYLELGSLSQVEVWTLTQNIRTCRGNLFDITGIRAILTNMVYVKADKDILNYCKSLGMDIASDECEFDGTRALMVYNKNIVKKGSSNKLRPTNEWIVAVGTHEGIISSSKFIKVQEKILKNQSKAPRTIRNNISILSPFLKCKHCGSNLRTTYGNKRKDGTRLYYYKCILKEKSRGKLCDTANLNGKATDNIIMSSLKNVDFSLIDYCEYLKAHKNNISSLNSLNSSNSSIIEKNIVKYQNRIRQLTYSLSLTTDSTSSKYIVTQIEDLDTNIVECEKKLQEILEESLLSSDDLLSIETLFDVIINFKSNAKILDNQEKRHVLNIIFDSISWDGNSLYAIAR